MNQTNDLKEQTARIREIRERAADLAFKMNQHGNYLMVHSVFSTHKDAKLAYQQYIADKHEIMAIWKMLSEVEFGEIEVSAQ